MKVLSAIDLPGLPGLADADGNIDLKIFADRDRFLEEAASADVLLLGGIDAEIVRNAGKCGFIQALSGGAEKFLIPELRASGIELATLSGCFNTAGAEHALALMLMVSRGLHRDLKNMPSKKMGPYRASLQFEIEGKTVGIFGLGAIGTELAKKCKALGMRVFGLGRTRPQAAASPLDSFFAPNALQEFLGSVDFLAVAVPLTEETRGLIGRRELGWMKKTACLIDISGRSEIYDYEELEKALSSGSLAAACMQPGGGLPAESPLWDCENFVFSFHRATSVEQSRLVIRRIGENIARFRGGKPLLGRVDFSAGY